MSAIKYSFEDGISKQARNILKKVEEKVTTGAGLRYIHDLFAL